MIWKKYKYLKYFVALLIILTMNILSYYLNGRFLWLTSNLVLLLLAYTILTTNKQN